MMWHDAITIPFTRIEIVSRVPANPGVYAVMSGETCLLVGDSWNLRARLLELANALTSDGSQSITITFEYCDNDSLSDRRQELEQQLLAANPALNVGLGNAPSRQRA
jgi:hypothetical protein